MRKITPEDNIFLIKRTSGDKPCVEAIKVQTIKTDFRSTETTDGVHYTDKSWFKRWYDKGENHRKWKEGICRDLGYQEEWAIEIIDIMDFIRKNGQCIIDYDLRGFKRIEIYDTWRE